MLYINKVYFIDRYILGKVLNIKYDLSLILSLNKKFGFDHWVVWNSGNAQKNV